LGTSALVMSGGRQPPCGLFSSLPTDTIAFRRFPQ
jgi:hypothetical protein